MADNPTEADGDAAPANTKPAPEPASKWHKKVLDEYNHAFRRWSDAKKRLDEGGPTVGDESQKQRRLAYNKEIEQAAQDLSIIVDAAAEAGSANGESSDGNLNALINHVRGHLGTRYLGCEKYEIAEEQFKEAVRGWEGTRSPAYEEVKKARLPPCRRGAAIAMSRGAKTKLDPQKAQLEALKLIMENINADTHIPKDVQICDNIVFYLVGGTYLPGGSDEDSYEACEAHIATLEEASVQLRSGTAKTEAVLAVLLFRVRMRILEILVDDLGNISRASNIYDTLGEFESPSFLEEIKDDGYKTLAGNLLKDREAFRRVIRKRETDELKLPALGPPATAPDSSAPPRTEEEAEDTPQPGLSRSMKNPQSHLLYHHQWLTRGHDRQYCRNRPESRRGREC